MGDKARKGGPSQSPPSEAAQNPFITYPSPPPDETAEERVQRLQGNTEAQALSRSIDLDLVESKKSLERRKKAVKILLLGQSESGKSAILRNFQITFSPSQLQREHGIWKRIIQLNLISHVKLILSILGERMPDALSKDNDGNTPPPLNKTLQRLYLSLSPLLSLDANLSQMVSAERFNFPEVQFKAGADWRAELCLKLGVEPGTLAAKTRRDVGDGNVIPQQYDPTPLLEASRDDIIALWHDSSVRDILAEKHLRMNEKPGFFLDDAARVTSSSYSPTDSDIIRARVRTLGVEEHHFIAEPGSGWIDSAGKSEFYVTDVAGRRSARAAWMPYFDDVQTILFLAPLAFNSMLDEDPRVNRVEDSLIYWREICKSELLAKSQTIIFFNKKDVLQAALDSGVMVKQFVPSFGDASNDIQTVTHYFKDRFKSYHKRLSPRPRPFLWYETSAVDVHSMSALLIAVHDGILREHLRESHVM